MLARYIVGLHWAWKPKNEKGKQECGPCAGGKAGQKTIYVNLC